MGVQIPVFAVTRHLPIVARGTCLFLAVSHKAESESRWLGPRGIFERACSELVSRTLHERLYVV